MYLVQIPMLICSMVLRLSGTLKSGCVDQFKCTTVSLLKYALYCSETRAGTIHPYISWHNEL